MESDDHGTAFFANLHETLPSHSHTQIARDTRTDLHIARMEQEALVCPFLRREKVLYVQLTCRKGTPSVEVPSPVDVIKRLRDYSRKMSARLPRQVSVEFFCPLTCA